MCGVENDITKKIGIITILSMIVLMVGVVIYTVISASYLQLPGTKVSLYILAILEYFMIVINAIMCIIGFIGFYINSKGLIIYYTIVQTIVLIISIFITAVFMANGIQGKESNRLSSFSNCYNTTSANNTIQLNNSINNPINYTFVVDYYVTKADQLYCSADCPCGYTGKDSFQNRTLITSNSGPLSFRNCPQKAINNVEIYSQNYGFSDSFEDLSKTLNWLETKFSCAGFCVTNYTDNSGMNFRIEKYLFSDINSGKPEKNGCLQALILWIIKFCLILGILDILILIPGLLLIIFGYMYWFNFKDAEPNNYGIIVSSLTQTQLKNSEDLKQQKYVPRYDDVPENAKNVEMNNQPSDNNKPQKREENYIDRN